MLTKPDESAGTATVSPPSCGNCDLEERRLLHHVRHRGMFRRLCTTCVLRLHPQSFCPTCYQVYPPAPSNDAVMSCFKCYSSSHSQCVAAGSVSPPSPYICPLCANPNSPIFKLRTDNEGSEDYRVIDKDAARKLLTAAKIASMSINKAVAAAKAEAERRAKEAALARKRVKEALELAACLVMKEKSRKKEAGLPVTPTIASSRNSFYSSIAKKPNTTNVSSSSRSENVGNAVDSLVVLEKKTNDMIDDVSELEPSAQVVAESNVVELNNSEKISEITEQDAELEGCLNDAMDEDEKLRTTEVDEGDISELLLDRIDIIGSKIDMAVDDNMQVEKQEDEEEENNRVVLDPSKEDQVESHDQTDDTEQQENGVPL